MFHAGPYTIHTHMCVNTTHSHYRTGTVSSGRKADLESGSGSPKVTLVIKSWLGVKGTWRVHWDKPAISLSRNGS